MRRATCSTGADPTLGEFLERLRLAAPAAAWDAPVGDSIARLEQFAAVCPLYARMIERDPEFVRWLDRPETRDSLIGLHSLLEETQRVRGGHGPLNRLSSSYPGFLRRFRRKMSLRIAYRDVSGFAPQDVVVEELTRLAEMMIRECSFIAQLRARQRWGEPWDEATDQPARFAILGLGKLGGRELNFSSDVDLIYLYEGEGQTRRDGHPTRTSNAEFFQRVAETITQLLNERDGGGFLFRVDVRLRPGGAAGPLAPSIESVENYYAASGQTWERLAWLKARTVAGDFALGGELLENLHSFRYPLHPPASLLAEVAAMKLRTEREVVGAAALERDVKSGFGGIREIEFIAQALQLLHAGRFPFLQTRSTSEALSQLVRYELMPAEDARFLTEAYWWLRRVEHRVQMAEELQTHELPEAPAERARVGESLGFPTLEQFDAHLHVLRHGVRRHYAALFANDTSADADPVERWWPFFADAAETPAMRVRLDAWFEGEEPAAAARALRLFVRGEENWPLSREQVQRFAALVPSFDRVWPRLARPRATLLQISTFGERYGSRNQLLAACTLNREFFEVLALLFDRSRFIAELLTRHPEIFDEVLRPEILHKRMDVDARRRDLAAHAPASDQDPAPWLWLYVRAEQVRAAIGHLLGFVSDDQIGAELAGIAEATLGALVARTPGAENLLIVALGNLGGGELSYGSDLDLVFLGREGSAEEESLVQILVQRLRGRAGVDATFSVDLRLRPHGDAGPWVSTLPAYRAYFAGPAQLWERQVLTRARVLSGPRDLAEGWSEFIAASIYSRPLMENEADELWRMRLRVQNERDVVLPPERAFKTAAGGEVDIEFALQILQLRHGCAHPELRQTNTRRGWAALADAKIIDRDQARAILDHHRHLQRIEWCLRRDQNRSVTTIPEAPDDQRGLARWLGAELWDDWWSDHLGRLRKSRQIVCQLLTGVVPSTTLERDR